MKKAFWIIIAILIAAGGSAVGYKVYQKATSQATAVAKKKKNQDTAVAIEAVKPQTANLRDRRMFSGSLRPWSVYNVSPKVTGRLLNLPYNIGDAVPSGSEIARLDDTEYRQQVNQASADLEVAEAQRKEAEVMLTLRQQEFDRQKTLTDKMIGSRAQFESAQSALLAQKATLAMKSAEVKRVEAALANARIKLSDTVMRGDWDEGGTRYVGERFVDEGALMQANQPIVSIAEIDRLKAAIFVIERDYPYVHPGQTAEITTDAYPDKVFIGKVSKISKVLQENARQATVLLEIPNRELLLKPGMFVRVHLEFARRADATVVPRSALVKRNRKTGVFRLSAADGKAYFTEVEPGIVVDDMVEIVTPKLKTPVITLGNHLLTHGCNVIVPPAFQVAEKPPVMIESQQTPMVKK